MASKTILRTLRTTSPLPHHHRLSIPNHTRPFLTLPSPPPTRLTETRILPYTTTSLYTLISDINNYSTFVPYCLASTITSWTTAPDSTNKSAAQHPTPTSALLKVGWGSFEEEFRSQLHCVPGHSVEARSGGDAPGGEIFRSLHTKWTVRPVHDGRPPPPRTEVCLALEFQFANPLYAALSAAVAPKVAGIMIEAFENRARMLLAGDGAAVAVGAERSSENYKMPAGKVLGDNGKIGA